jgi:hypothetical protein
MKRFLVLGAGIVLSAAWFAACKSGTTTPSSTADYMPMSPGNYWVYERYELDSTGQRTSGPSYDSVVVGAAVQFQGRTAYPFYTYTDGEIQDTSYYAKDADGNVWMYFAFDAGDVAGGAQVPSISSRWIKVISVGNESSWTIIDTTLTNVQIDPLPPTNIRINITISKAGSESISVAGKSYTAQKFTWNTTITPAIQLFTLNSTATDWAVSGVGYAKHTSQTTLNVPLIGMNSKSGSQSTLIRFKVQ